MVDAVLPLLATRSIMVKNRHVLLSITTLFGQVAPVALRPLIMLFSCVFAVASPQVRGRGTLPVGTLVSATLLYPFFVALV